MNITSVTLPPPVARFSAKPKLTPQENDELVRKGNENSWITKDLIQMSIRNMKRLGMTGQEIIKAIQEWINTTTKQN